MEFLGGFAIGVVVGAIGYKFFLPLIMKLWAKIKSFFPGGDKPTDPA
jgi:hypothetical protein